MSDDWREKARIRHEAKLAAEKQAQIPNQEKHEPDLIPEPVFIKTEEEEQVDRFIDNITCLEAYEKWCGKSHPSVHKGQTEGIKVSCPIPGHPDKDPSAWINTRDNVWFCGACQEGGDKFDIAAYHFGYDVPGYKVGADFHNLRREMAESYGWTYVKGFGTDIPVAIAPEDSTTTASDILTNTDKPDEKSDISSEHIPASDSKPVLTVVRDDTADVVKLFPLDDETKFPGLDWHKIVTPSTFLDAYMKETTKDDVPEEFHFWNGLIALGLSIGRQVAMRDEPDVFGNLFVCTLGHSGSGKSKAKYYLDKVVNAALPFTDDPFTIGVHKISAPGSAEALIAAFSKQIIDPLTSKPMGYAPVRGLIYFSELSALIGRTNRVGNIIKPTMMDLYDMEDVISTTSLTHGTKKADKPFGCAITTTQPRAVSTLLTQADADSGFLNRWVFAAGPYKRRMAFVEYEMDFTEAISKLQEITAWAATKPAGIIEKDPAAKEVFENFFRNTIEVDQYRDKTGMLVRLDLLMKKLMLLFAANEKKDSVDKESVEKALEVYPYIKSCYEILSTKIGDTDATQIRDGVRKLLSMYAEKYPAGIPTGKINDHFKTRKYPVGLVVKVLKDMADLGEIECIIATKAPKGTMRWKIAN